MNNKGFTLIELVVAIALLAIISLISYVSISKVVEDSKIKDCEKLVMNIKSAMKEYVSDNRYNSDFINIVEQNGDEDDQILLDLLTDNKYLSMPVINPFTNETINVRNVTILFKLNNNYMISNENDAIVIKNDDNEIVNCENNKW